MQGLPANYWRLWGSSAASNLADGLFFIALYVFFYARGIERGANDDFLWAGLCGSMSFLIRPGW